MVLPEPNVSAWTFLQFLEFFGPKLLLALACGGVIGLERELKNKAAGVKTNMMICVGAALYSSVSVLVSATYASEGFFGDPSRVAAQIVSGIGFLGGGAIIQARGTVVGLTTAATIWVVAAIGLCIGVGYERFAVMATLLVMAVLVIITALSRKFIDRVLLFSCDLVLDDPEGSVRGRLYDVLRDNDLEVDSASMSQGGEEGYYRLKLKYNGRPEDHRKFLVELWGMPGVKEVKQK